MQCDVTLKKENSVSQEGFMVEAKLAIPGKDLFAKEMADSYATAVDKVIDDLVSQINKHKSKLNRKAMPADAFTTAEEDQE
jgi:ribosomal subunit interface protein